MVRSAISGFVLLWAAFFVVGCQAVDDEGKQTVAYQSVWSQLYPASHKPSPDTGTLQGSFIYAVSAQSLEVAKKRWSGFIDQWKPQDGHFEDSMHARLIAWAELEMRRTSHLEVGNLAAAQGVDTELRKFARQME